MSSPYVGIPVIAFLVFAILAVLYGLYQLIRAIRYEARSAQHTAAGVQAAREADDYTGQLRREPLALPPGPSAGNPPWEIAGDSWDYRAAVLPNGSGQFPMLPPDAPEPEVADTGVIPVELAELDGVTTGEFVARKFAEADAAVAAAWNGMIP